MTTISSNLDGRRNERIRVAKRIKRDVRAGLRVLRDRDTDSIRDVQVRVAAMSVPLASEWPDMNPIGLELAARILELVARSAPDAHSIRTGIERIMHLDSGIDTIALQVATNKHHPPYDNDYIDRIVDHYQGYQD